MIAKKIHNAPAAVVEDYITGLLGSTNSLSRLTGWPVVVRSARKADDRVVLISGGGSGHEPAHAGYVGSGMLDAAVLGPVFTSPSVDAVYAAIRAVATTAGVLLIVKNYTGDRLNFGLAAEMARADGIRVETVVVADDAALGDSSRAGRRGLTATVLVHKIAGAAAERGWPIERIADMASRLLSGAATMGVALGAATVPGATSGSFELGAGEVEWGLGIHGEAGSERGSLVPSSDIAGALVDRVVADRGIGRGDEVVVVVNSLGGTPDLDLRILHGDVLARLREQGVVVRMTWAGPFLTSLEMPGASVTVARVDDELLDLLADEARVLSFPRESVRLDSGRSTAVPSPHTFEVAAGDGPSPSVVAVLHGVVDAAVEAVLGSALELTSLDGQVGDGDLGINLARGASAVREAEEVLLTQPTVRRYLAAVSDIVRREVGGTSGPLYSILLLTMSEAIGDDDPDAAAWTAAFAAGVARVRDVGGAAPGDSTMVDALQPAIDALATGEGLAAAAAAARAGAESTAALRPALGRSSYVGERAVGIPDPGAMAVAIELDAVRAAVEPREDG